MQPKTRRRLARLGCAALAALVLVPFVLLHGMSFMFSRHDRKMQEFPSQVIKDASGRAVRYYELKRPDAEWNIVFIHGTPGSAAAFIEQFRQPFPKANILALDRPGFGGSQPALRHPSLDDQAAAVGLALEALPARPTILVGHSYGGPIALEAALKFTNRVAGVVLIGGSVDPAQEKTLLIQHIGNLPVIEWLVPRLFRQCNRELMSLRGDLVKLKTELPAVAVPVVMLHGEKDPLVPVANVDYLRAQIAAAGKSNLFGQLVFPDYNHFIPWEHPDAVAAAIEMVTKRVK